LHDALDFFHFLSMLSLLTFSAFWTAKTLLLIKESINKPEHSLTPQKPSYFSYQIWKRRLRKGLLILGVLLFFSTIEPFDRYYVKDSSNPLFPYYMSTLQLFFTMGIIICNMIVGRYLISKINNVYLLSTLIALLSIAILIGYSFFLILLVFIYPPLQILIGYEYEFVENYLAFIPICGYWWLLIVGSFFFYVVLPKLKNTDWLLRQTS